MSRNDAVKQVQFWGEMLEVAKRSSDPDAVVPYWQSLYDKGCAIRAAAGLGKP